MEQEMTGCTSSHEGSRLSPGIRVAVQDVGREAGGSGLWLWKWRTGRAERLGKEEGTSPGTIGARGGRNEKGRRGRAREGGRAGEDEGRRRPGCLR